MPIPLLAAVVTVMTMSAVAMPPAGRREQLLREQQESDPMAIWRELGHQARARRPVAGPPPAQPPPQQAAAEQPAHQAMSVAAAAEESSTTAAAYPAYAWDSEEARLAMEEEAEELLDQRPMRRHGRGEMMSGRWQPGKSAQSVAAAEEEAEDTSEGWEEPGSLQEAEEERAGADSEDRVRCLLCMDAEDDQVFLTLCNGHSFRHEFHAVCLRRCKPFTRGPLRQLVRRRIQCPLCRNVCEEQGDGSYINFGQPPREKDYPRILQQLRRVDEIVRENDRVAASVSDQNSTFVDRSRELSFLRARMWIMTDQRQIIDQIRAVLDGGSDVDADIDEIERRLDYLDEFMYLEHWIREEFPSQTEQFWATSVEQILQEDFHQDRAAVMSIMLDNRPDTEVPRPLGD